MSPNSNLLITAYLLMIKVFVDIYQIAVVYCSSVFFLLIKKNFVGVTKIFNICIRTNYKDV